MKNTILISIKLTIVCAFIFCGVYPLLVWGIAQTGRYSGKGETQTVSGKKYYVNIGQTFTDDKYFYSRPSAVSYNASSSGGSNKGPFNKEYLSVIKARIDTFLVHNPEIRKNQIPIDIITASGSGLDPHISVQAAMIQVNRIAKVRNIKSDIITELVEKNTEKPLNGLVGIEYVNVVRLNSHLDKL